MNFQPLRDFEDDYEIEVEEPHRIRRIGSDRFVTPSLDRSNGYVHVYLNQTKYSSKLEIWTTRNLMILKKSK